MGTRAAQHDNSTGIPAGKVLGADPDPHVRFEIMRDGNSYLLG